MHLTNINIRIIVFYVSNKWLNEAINDTCSHKLRISSRGKTYGWFQEIYNFSENSIQFWNMFWSETVEHCFTMAVHINHLIKNLLFFLLQGERWTSYKFTKWFTNFEQFPLIGTRVLVNNIFIVFIVNNFKFMY